MQLCGVHVMQVGKFLVVDADDIRKIYQQADFAKMDEKTKKILDEIQKEFFKSYSGGTLDFSLYDWHALNGGNIRAVFPHDILRDAVEPSCGTGSVAIGVTVVAKREVERENIYRDGEYKVSLETGGGTELGGPERTDLYMSSFNSMITNISFSHSLVKITAIGELII